MIFRERQIHLDFVYEIFVQLYIFAQQPTTLKIYEYHLFGHAFLLVTALLVLLQACICFNFTLPCIDQPCYHLT